MYGWFSNINCAAHHQGPGAAGFSTCKPRQILSAKGAHCYFLRGLETQHLFPDLDVWRRRQSALECSSYGTRLNKHTNTIIHCDPRISDGGCDWSLPRSGVARSHLRRAAIVTQPGYAPLYTRIADDVTAWTSYCRGSNKMLRILYTTKITRGWARPYCQWVYKSCRYLKSW